MLKYRIIHKKGQGAKTKYYYHYIMADSKENALIKFMSLHPTSDEVYEVLCSKDKHDAAYILSTVMAAIE